jgi:hypothetical protein
LGTTASFTTTPLTASPLTAAPFTAGSALSGTTKTASVGKMRSGHRQRYTNYENKNSFHRIRLSVFDDGLIVRDAKQALLRSR